MMKLFLCLILPLIAYVNAIGLEISAVTKKNSEGFVVFSFSPPEKSHNRLDVEILLPGIVTEYNFKDCFHLALPDNKFTPDTHNSRLGYTSLLFSRSHTFHQQKYTYICPFVAPSTVDVKQVGIYINYNNLDYFASAPGGTYENMPFAAKFTANVANSYIGAPTQFLFQGAPIFISDWVLRIGTPIVGHPRDPNVTEAVSVVFEHLNPLLLCDLTFQNGDHRATLEVTASINDGAIFIDMPKNRFSDYELLCPDIILNYPTDHSAVVEISSRGLGLSSYSWVRKPVDP